MINPGSVQICGQNLVMIVIVRIELWLLVALKWFVDYVHFLFLKIEDMLIFVIVNHCCGAFLLSFPEVSVQTLSPSTMKSFPWISW